MLPKFIRVKVLILILYEMAQESIILSSIFLRILWAIWGIEMGRRLFGPLPENITKKIYWVWKNEKLSFTALGERFGIHRNSVSNIIKREAANDKDSD